MWSTLFLFETILSLTCLLVLTIYYEEKSLRRFIEETKEVVILNTVYFSNLTNIGTHNTKAITQVVVLLLEK